MSDRRTPIIHRSSIGGGEQDANEQQTASNSNEQSTVVLRSNETPIPSETRQSNASNISATESTRSRSKTVPGITSDVSHVSTSPSTGFNFLQSIKDLTHQELFRANPLGLLGKEIISATGTTHCPEPIPPKEDENGITSSINENEPQQIHFPLNEEDKIQMQRRRSTIPNLSDSALPPCPAEFISDSTPEDLQPRLFSQLSPTTLVADFIPDTMTINVFEVFIYAWGVFAFFFDMVTDLVLAHAYYLEGAYWLFILTLMCVILPNVTLSVFSLVWYIDGSQLKAAAASEKQTTTYETNLSDTNIEKIPLQDKSHQVESVKNKKHLKLSSTTANIFTWIIRIIILVLQLDLCLKYIRGLYYTWKGFQKRHNPKWARFYLTKQILIDADIALLRVFDCFMDSGSQVTLQLYIMLRFGSQAMKFDTLFLKQCLSIGSSLGSLAYALSGYSRCWRHMQLTHSPQGWPKGKPPPKLVSWWSTIIQWVWYFFLITPRVLALAMFAATFRSWFWIILIAHWCAMLFWILRFRTIFCISDQTKYNPREAIFEKCYNLVCSYIFIFCYMNLRKGDTRAHYIGFYTIYYIENIAFSIIYAIHSAETNLVVKYSLVTFVCGGFWLAILFQFLYYRFLHPSDHVRHSVRKNISSFVRVQSTSRITRTKSCEDILEHHERRNSNDLMETTSLKFDTTIDESWHNRFSFANRQKLISQQQAIDQKVKLERRNNPTQSFLTKISTTLKKPTKTQTPLINQSSLDEKNETSSRSFVSDKRTPQHQQQSKLYNIDEDNHLDDNQKEHGDEMILTATKLAAQVVPNSSSSAKNNN